MTKRDFIDLIEKLEQTLGIDKKVYIYEENKTKEFENTESLYDFVSAKRPHHPSFAELGVFALIGVEAFVLWFPLDSEWTPLLAVLLSLAVGLILYFRAINVFMRIFE